MLAGRRRVPLAAFAIALAWAVLPGLAFGQGGKQSGKKKQPATAQVTKARAAGGKRAAVAKVARPKKKATTTKRRASVPPSRLWHRPTPGATAPLDAAGRPMLTLQGLNVPDRVTIAASGDGGGFSAEALDRAARVLRDPRTGDEHPVDPRLLDVVYRIAVEFSAHEIRVVSGYRTPRSGKASNHGKGRAIDLVVPGARDEDVAKFARQQGFVGVGVYPKSGFVHIDVRESSYFWVDHSGPGKRQRTRRVLPALASKSDARALARGESPVRPFGISTNVDRALASSPSIGPFTTIIEDDDVDLD